MSLERMIAHVPEFEARNGLGGVAGQRLAGRRHIDRDPPPTAGAGLGIARVIVGDHHVDDQLALEANARRLDERDRFLDLFPRRHQRGAVGERPAVILGMRDFEPARAEFDRKIDERADLMQIGAMDDRVDGERQAGLDHISRRRRACAPTSPYNGRGGRWSPCRRPGRRAAHGRGRRRPVRRSASRSTPIPEVMRLV